MTGTIQTIDAFHEPMGFEGPLDFGGDGLSIVTLTVPAGANACVIQANTSPVRMRDDGTNPVVGPGGTGFLIAAGRDLWYIGDLSAVRIAQEDPGAEVNILYYRVRR